MNTHRNTHVKRGVPTTLLWASLITAAAAIGTSCGSSSSGSSEPPTFVNGTVKGPSGVAVQGAKVYLVPASAIDLTEITGAGVLAGTSLPYDEPLEDAVANAGNTFTRTTTASDGSYEIANVPDGSFFLYVEPGASDTEHLAGGSLCTTVAKAGALRGTTRNIKMSSSPPVGATYAGMSTCLTCHADYATEKTLAHRLGFRVPGVSSPLQDTSAHPEIDEGLEYFIEGPDYTTGTPVYHYDFDGSRGFDKFRTSLTDPTGDGGVVYAILWLWKDDGTGEHKITIENVGNSGDPNNFAERTAQLTYGGAVEKQRYMIDWPGRNGLYPMLQFQTDGD